MSTMRWAGAAFLIMLHGGAPGHARTFAHRPVTVDEIHGSPRPKTLTAPDGHTRAVARFSTWKFKEHDSLLSVFVGGDDHVFPGGPDAELLWAPDSNAIAVTAEDVPDESGKSDASDDADADSNASTAADTDAAPAGADRKTHFEATILVRPARGRHWRRFDLTDSIAELFAPKMRCDDPDEKPDVAVVGWTSGKRAVVVAQVPSDADCANPGSYAGFIVDTATGVPLMDIDARTLDTRYRSMLGRRLLSGSKHRRHRRHR